MILNRYFWTQNVIQKSPDKSITDQLKNDLGHYIVPKTHSKGQWKNLSFGKWWFKPTHLSFENFNEINLILSLLAPFICKWDIFRMT